METSLPQRYAWVYNTICSLNQKLDDLGDEAESITQKVNLEFGTIKELIQFEQIAENAVLVHPFHKKMGALIPSSFALFSFTEGSVSI